MKCLKYIMAILLVTGFSINTNAQILKKLKKKAEQKVEREAEKRAQKRIDKKIDEEMDEIEDEIDGKKKDPDKKEENKPNQKPEVKKDENAIDSEEPTLLWHKYDFIPGDKVIFEDNLENEENGEFPSRWDLAHGTVENAAFGGENIIMFRGNNPKIVPYLKNPEKDYLPDIFTIEFDLYMNNHNSFTVYFWDHKNQKSKSEFKALEINYRGMYFSHAGSKIPNNETIDNKWAHIAIAHTNGKFKAYIDETRLINIPRLAFNPIGISLRAYHGSDINTFYIKNFRLAKGGIKYYDRVLSEGKIIVNGIKFDVNKATLKPESMGPINSIFKMMKNNTELNFSVEGHTDSDGSDTANMTLSIARGKTVMEKLIKMGIAPNRLKSTGFGESKPIDNNNTPEGKANNRRVEFVKF